MSDDYQKPLDVSEVRRIICGFMQHAQRYSGEEIVFEGIRQLILQEINSRIEGEIYDELTKYSHDNLKRILDEVDILIEMKNELLPPAPKHKEEEESH